MSLFDNYTQLFRVNISRQIVLLIIRYTSCLIFLIDSQAFGVLVAFFPAFVCANFISLIVIFIVVQITLSIPVRATLGFFVGNVSAFIIGSYLGDIVEAWHLHRMKKLEARRANGIRKELNLNNDEVNIFLNYYNDDDLADEIYDVEISPILQPKSFLEESEKITEFTDDRNIYYKISVCFVIIIGNMFGAIVTSTIPESFPTMLRHGHHLSA